MKSWILCSPIKRVCIALCKGNGYRACGRWHRGTKVEGGEKVEKVEGVNRVSSADLLT